MSAAEAPGYLCSHSVQQRNYLTVTTNFFVIPLHFTVIVALPFLIPFTTPLLFTAATFLLLLVYVTLPAGAALDLMVVVLPFLIVAEDFTRLNAGFLTTTLQVVFRAPAFAVIVTVPALIPFTTPVLLFTVAIFVLLLVIFYSCRWCCSCFYSCCFLHHADCP